MIKRITTMLFITLAVSLPLFGQTADGGNASLSEAPSVVAAKTHILDSVEYRIEGFVLERALAAFLDFEVGKEFDGGQELQEYVAEKERQLRNNRIFDLASSITLEEAPRDESGVSRAKAIIHAKASWSALALPFPKYNSSDGLSLAVRYKDYNFVGTMLPMSLTFDYYFATNRFKAGVDFSLYPKFFAASWNLSLSGDASLVDGAIAYPNAAASLTTTYSWEGLGLAWFFSPAASYLYETQYLRHTASVGSTFGFSFNALLDWRLSTSASYGMERITYASQYLRNGLALSTSVELFKLPYFGQVTLSPGSELFLKTALPDLSPSDSGFIHSAAISLSRVDWVGNFRNGLSGSIGATYVDHFIVPTAADAYDLDLYFNASAFYSLGNLVGVNARVTGKWFATWTFLGEAASHDWKDYIRGRKDSSIGDLGVIANLELPVNFAQGDFFGVSLLNAEVFFVPFVDVGYVRTTPGAEPDFSADGILCGGFEFVIYPSRARAFAYRASVGYDVADYLRTRDFQTGKLEVWLGLGMLF